MNKQLILECIEGYEQDIEDYREMLAENEKRISAPSCSKKRKDAFEALNQVIRQEIAKCQGQIKRLISE